MLLPWRLPVSLRFGHARGLTAHWAVIQYPRAASLPYAFRLRPAAVILERSEESRQGNAFDDRGGGFCEALREYNKSQKFPYRQKRAALNAAISAFKTALFV